VRMLAREGAPPGREAAAGGGSLVEELRRRDRAEEVSGERLGVGRSFFFTLSWKRRFRTGRFDSALLGLDWD
jgi:hypothetical protein